jgi:Trypsin.
MSVEFSSAQASTGSQPLLVDDVLSTPWRWICSIQVEYPEDVLHSPSGVPRDVTFGSGVLITPRHVLTNAHLIVGYKTVRQHKFIVHPKKITVSPGRDDRRLNSRPYGNYNVISRHVAPQYSATNSESLSAPFDYAVLELNRDVGNRSFLKIDGRLGWWGQAHNSYIRSVDSNFRQVLASRKVNVAGYPNKGDVEFTMNSTPAGIQHYDFDSVVDAFPRMQGQLVSVIRYAAMAGDGQSGGPVWIKEKSNGRRYLVAIHQARETLSNSHRQGVLITPSLIQQLYSWGIPRNLLSVVS